MKKDIMLFQKDELPHITYQEFQKLLMNTKDIDKRILLKIMWLYGLRVSEVLMLRKDDLIKKEDGYYLMITRLKKKKTRITVLPLKFEVGFELENYINMFKIEDRIFKYTRQAIWSWLKNLSKRVLNRNIHPHMLRHGRVYDLIKKGVHWAEIVKILDWEDPRLLLRYFHPSMDDIRGIIEKT